MVISRLALIPYIDDIFQLIKNLSEAFADGKLSEEEAAFLCKQHLYPLLDGLHINIPVTMREHIPQLLSRLFSVFLLLLDEIATKK